VIAEYREPKGLHKDTPAIGAFRAAGDHRDNAERGSAMLRDAILRAMGVTPKRIEPRPVVREVAHLPKACPHCGAPAKPLGLMIAHIQHTVAAYYGLEPGAMTSAQRGYQIAHPRQIAMYLASTLTPKSLPEIGRRFGGRDHTTVIYAIKAVKSRMESDAEILLDVEVLRERLTG
jgi:hypothetical protein